MKNTSGLAWKRFWLQVVFSSTLGLIWLIRWRGTKWTRQILEPCSGCEVTRIYFPRWFTLALWITGKLITTIGCGVKSMSNHMLMQSTVKHYDKLIWWVSSVASHYLGRGKKKGTWCFLKNGRLIAICRLILKINEKKIQTFGATSFDILGCLCQKCVFELSPKKNHLPGKIKIRADVVPTNILSSPLIHVSDKITCKASTKSTAGVVGKPLTE